MDEYEVIEIKDLSKRLKKLYERGEEVAEHKDYTYAMEMFREILKKEPGALGVRWRLRQIQYTKMGGKVTTGNHILVNTIALPVMLWNTYLLKTKDEKKHIAAMDLAEKIMALDPTARMPIMMLDRALYELGIFEGCVQTLEWALQFYPKSLFFWDRLGQAYGDAGMGSKSLLVYKKLTELSPMNKAFQEKLKDATAEAAIEPWSMAERGEADFRSVIRDKGEAARLEQAGHTMRTPEGIRQLIEGILDEIKETGDTVDKRKQLADFYVELKEWDEAITNFELMMEISGIADPAIEQHIISAKVRKYDQRIGAAEKAALKASNPDKAQEFRAEVLAIRAEKIEALLGDMRARVKKYPNQHQDRLELAKMLYEKEEYDEAIGHFQHLQTHPQAGIAATLYLGRCFYSKHVFDLAIEQYSKVIDEIKNMTNLKKDAYYDLGKAYEAMGNQEEAATTYKIIYSADMNFRDVGEIIDNLYKD